MGRSTMKLHPKLGLSLILMLAAVVLGGCQAVALTNRTNLPVYAGALEQPYSAENDIFLYGPPTWRYELRVRDVNVERSSVQPSVVIDGISHPMSLLGDWDGDVSLWVYDRPAECATANTPWEAESDYYFSVDYQPTSNLAPDPPERTKGTYTSRILCFRVYFEPEPPYPNHALDGGMIYDQNCWDTGTRCAPVWKRSEMFDPAYWPSELGLGYTFVLRNAEPQDVIITELTLGPLGTDTSSFQKFQIVNTPLPITIPACGGTAEISLGYYPNSTPGNFHHSLQLTSKIQFPGLPVHNGPYFNVDYRIEVNPP